MSHLCTASRMQSGAAHFHFVVNLMVPELLLDHIHNDSFIARSFHENYMAIETTDLLGD